MTDEEKIGIKTRVSAIIFINKKLVVTKHYVKGFGTYYLLPGGGIEKGESPDEALEREIKEEINLDVKERRLIFYRTGYNNKDTYLTLIFLCKTKGKLKIPRGEKHVRSIELIKNAKELKKLKFYPKHITDKIFSKLPERAEFLGKFKFPED